MEGGIRKHEHRRLIRNLRREGWGIVSRSPKTWSEDHIPKAAGWDGPGLENLLTPPQHTMNIPTFEEACRSFEKTPLDSFLMKHQPFTKKEGEEFRADLQSLVDWLLSQKQD